MRQGSGVVNDNKKDEVAGRMASSAAEGEAGREDGTGKEEGIGKEEGTGKEGEYLADGVVFNRVRELTLTGGVSSCMGGPKATSDTVLDVDGGEGFDSTLARLARSAVHWSCVSIAFLPARRERFNGGSPSSGRLK